MKELFDFLGVDPLIIVIGKSEVEHLDTSAAMSVLSKLYESPQTARAFLERVDIAFHGYDQNPHELFEIAAVREFVYALDKQFPYWLYFLSKHWLGLQCIVYCFLPPFLTAEARGVVFPSQINDLLTRRWFPAMADMCELTGFSNEQVEELVNRAVQYITEGRFPPGSQPLRTIPNYK